MSLSFTKEYYPDLDELTPEQFAAAREKVVLMLREAMPDVDFADNTPTGDLVISPMAAERAAAEEANNRLMSDLDLGNVASGVIYSCEFVRAYLGNFAVYDVENLRGFGLVRLVYSSPAARLVPRTIRFRFGGDDDWYLKVVNPDASSVSLLEAGSEHNGNADTFVLAQTSATTWAVDLPVECTLTTPVTRGASGTATEIDAALVGLSAATDFDAGVMPSSLVELAKLARKVAFSLTAGSRASTQSLIYRHWPESNMVSPVVPGDQELQRVAAGSALALQAPAVDVYFRSARDLQRETQNVKLYYVQPAGGGSKVFRGALTFMHRPARIVGVEWSGTTNTSYVASKVIYSRSHRGDLYGSLHCGTRYETFYIDITPVLDDVDIPLIPLTDAVEDGSPVQYAIFTVTYDADPLLETVASTLESPDYRPAGVDVLVKAGPLLDTTNITITYSKKQGVRTTLAWARDQISAYMRTVGYPDPFRLIELHRIMRNAGADQVLSITGNGTIRVSPADRLLRSTISDPLAADFLADWTAGSDPLATIAVASIDNFIPDTIIDGEISAGGPPDAWAATNRTIRYAADAGNIQFVEV